MQPREALTRAYPCRDIHNPSSRCVGTRPGVRRPKGAYLTAAAAVSMDPMVTKP
jgi:hypothetical protein